MSHLRKFSKIKKLFTATSMLTAVLASSSVEASVVSSEYLVNYGQFDPAGEFSSFGGGSGTAQRWNGSDWDLLGSSFGPLNNDDVVILTNDASIDSSTNIALWIGIDNGNSNVSINSWGGLTILGMSHTPDLAGSNPTGGVDLTVGGTVNFGSTGDAKTLTNQLYLGRVINPIAENISSIYMSSNATLVGNIGGDKYPLSANLSLSMGSNLTLQNMNITATSGSLYPWQNLTLHNSNISVPGTVATLYIDSGVSTVSGFAANNLKFTGAATLNVNNSFSGDGGVTVPYDASLIGQGSQTLTYSNGALDFQDSSATFTLNNVNVTVSSVAGSENANLAFANNVGFQSGDFSLSGIVLNDDVTLVGNGETITVGTFNAAEYSLTLINIKIVYTNVTNLTSVQTMSGASFGPPTYFSSADESKTLTSDYVGNIDTVSTGNSLNLAGYNVTGNIGDITHRIASLVASGNSQITGTTYVDALSFAQDGALTISDELNVTNSIDISHNASFIGNGQPQAINVGSVTFSNQSATVILQNVALTATNVTLGVSNVLSLNGASLTATNFESGAGNTINLNGIVNFSTGNIGNLDTVLLSGDTTFIGNGQVLDINNLDFASHNITLSGVTFNVLNSITNGGINNITLGEGGGYTNKTNYFTGHNQTKTYSGEGAVVSSFEGGDLILDGDTDLNITDDFGAPNARVNNVYVRVDSTLAANLYATNLIFDTEGVKLTVGDGNSEGKIYVKNMHVNANNTSLIGNGDLLEGGVRAELISLSFDGDYTFTLDNVVLTVQNQIVLNKNVTLKALDFLVLIPNGGMEIAGNQTATLSNITFQGNITGREGSVLALNSTIVSNIDKNQDSVNVHTVSGTGALTIQTNLTTNELQLDGAYLKLESNNLNIAEIAVTGSSSTLRGNGNQVIGPLRSFSLTDGDTLNVTDMTLLISEGRSNNADQSNVTGDVIWLQSEFTAPNMVHELKSDAEYVITDHANNTLILNGYDVTGTSGVGVGDQYFPIDTLVVNAIENRASTITGNVYADNIDFQGGILTVNQGNINTQTITVTSNGSGGITGTVGDEKVNSDNGFTSKIAVYATEINFAANSNFTLQSIAFDGDITTANNGILNLTNSTVTGNIGAIGNALAEVNLTKSNVTGNITATNTNIKSDAATVGGNITGDVTFVTSSTLTASDILGNVIINDNVTATIKGATLTGITGITGIGTNSVLVLNDNFTVTGQVSQLKEIQLGAAVTLTIDGDNDTQNITGTDTSNIILLQAASIKNLNNVGMVNASINSVTLREGGVLVGSIYAKTIKVDGNAAKTLELTRSITSNVELSHAAHNIDIANGVHYNGDIKANNGGGILTFKGSASFHGSLGVTGSSFGQVSIANAGSVVKGYGSIYATNVNHSAGTLYVFGDLNIAGNYNLKGGTLDINSSKFTTDKLMLDVGNNIIKVALSSGAHIATKEVDFAPTAVLNITVTDNIVQQNGTTFDVIVSDKTTQDRSKILEYLSDKKLVTISSNNKFSNYILKLSPIESGSQAIKLQAVTHRIASEDKELISAIGSSSSISAQGLLKDMLSAWDSGKITGSAEEFISSLGNMSVASGAEAFTRVTSAAVPSVVHSVVNNVISAAHSVLVPRMSISAMAAADDKAIDLGIWGSAFGGHASQKAYGKQGGSTSNSKGIAIGFDTEINDDTMAGLSLTHSVSKAKLKGTFDGDVVDATNYALSFYGVANLSGNWFTEGSVSLGNSNIRSANSRVVGDNASVTAKSKFEVVSYAAQLMGGYHYKVAEHTVLTPVMGVSYARYNPADTKETGAGIQNRTIEMKAVNKVNGVLGSRVSHNIILDDNNMINLEMHGNYERSFKSKAPSTNIKLDGYDKSLSSGAEKPASNSYNIGMSATAKSGMIEYGAGYDLNLSKKYNAHQGSVKLKVHF